MFGKSKYTLMKKNNLKNCIFNFLEIQDIFTIRNLNKQTRNIVNKHQKNFIKFINIQKKLIKRKIKKVSDLCEEEELTNEILETEEIFKKIFEDLFEKEKYEIYFDNSFEEKRRLGYKILFYGLKKSKKLRELLIYRLNFLEGEEREFFFQKLIEIIKVNKHLYSINLDFCYIGSYPQYNNSLTHILLVFNDLGSNPNNIKCLRDALYYNHTLIHIDLNSNDIGSYLDNMKYLSEGLNKNHSLTKLYLGNNRIGSHKDNMKYLAESLKRNNTLNYIDFNSNLIGCCSENMVHLSEALKQNYSLKYINLSANKIGSSPYDIKYFSECLKYNKSLQKIKLSMNKIGSFDDMQYLAEAIMENCSLAKLDLSYNFIGMNDEDVKYLYDGLKKNNSLTKINLYCNKNLSNDFNKKYFDDLKKENTCIEIYF